MNKIVRKVELGTKKHLRPGDPEMVMLRFGCVTKPGQEPVFTEWFVMKRALAVDLQTILALHLGPSQPIPPGQDFQ